MDLRNVPPILIEVKWRSMPWGDAFLTFAVVVWVAARVGPIWVMPTLFGIAWLLNIAERLWRKHRKGDQK